MSVKIATREQEREIVALINRMFLRDLIPADHAKHVISHPIEFTNAFLAMMARLAHHQDAITTVRPFAKAPSTDWERFYGPYRRMNLNFDQENFPMGPKGRARGVIEHRFHDRRTGQECLEWAASRDLELSGPWETAEYLDINLSEVKLKVVGCGQWKDLGDVAWMPFFYLESQHGHPRRKQLIVDLRRLNSPFSDDYLWLFSPKHQD